MPAEKATAFEIRGLNQLLKVLNQIPKDLQNEIRDASTAIATDLVTGAQAAARTPLQVMVAGGLKVKRDRIPIVRAGTGVVRPGTRMNDVFYGAEFGGQRRPTTQQFLPHRGRRGYFLYPTARAHGKRYAAMWAEAVDKAFKSWDYKAPTGTPSGGND